MSHEPYVDNDGNELEDYQAYRDYHRANKLPHISDAVSDPDGDVITLTTRQSGIVFGFKTILDCEINHDCKYHGQIKECNTEASSVSLHASIKLSIENGEDLG